VTSVEVGLLIRYGKLVPGREVPAIELFQESMRYLEEKRDLGEITYFEPFFFMTSDLDEELGFWLVKGPAPAIFAIMEEEAFKLLMQKSIALVEHMRMDWLTVGDGIAEQVERSMKVFAGLSI
jgi:hypothetical protein